MNEPTLKRIIIFSGLFLMLSYGVIVKTIDLNSALTYIVGVGAGILFPTGSVIKNLKGD